MGDTRVTGVTGPKEEKKEKEKEEKEEEKKEEEKKEEEKKEEEKKFLRTGRDGTNRGSTRGPRGIKKLQRQNSPKDTDSV